MSTQPTPRTDAAAIKCERLDGDIEELVGADFARTFERELATLRQQLADAQDDVKRLHADKMRLLRLDDDQLAERASVQREPFGYVQQIGNNWSFYKTNPLDVHDNGKPVIPLFTSPSRPEQERPIPMGGQHSTVRPANPTESAPNADLCKFCGVSPGEKHLFDPTPAWRRPESFDEHATGADTIKETLNYSGNGKVSVSVSDILNSPKVQRQVTGVREIAQGSQSTIGSHLEEAPADGHATGADQEAEIKKFSIGRYGVGFGADMDNMRVESEHIIRAWIARHDTSHDRLREAADVLQKSIDNCKLGPACTTCLHLKWNIKAIEALIGKAGR